MAFHRYGYEQYYSREQINFSYKELGHLKYFEEETALALIGNPKELKSYERYRKIRRKFGIEIDGALEVLKVYGKKEKVPLDPFGSDRAQQTAHNDY